MQLTKEDIANFNRSGFLLIKGVFAGDELKKLDEAADRVLAEALRGEGVNHGRILEDDPSTHFRTEGLLNRDPAFDAIAANPDLLRCVGQCMGKPFLLMNDRMVVKHAHRGAPAEWHQDPPYLGDEGRPETHTIPNFVADIWLDKTNDDNGCLYALKGRHLCGRVAWPGMTDEDLFHHKEAVPLFVEPGDVTFHALSTPHGSRATVNSRKRRLILYHYVCKEVYEESYSGWMNMNGGYSSENAARFLKMRALREQMGWNTDYTDIIFTSEGAEYRGSVVQHAEAWARLIHALTPEALEAQRLVTR